MAKTLKVEPTIIPWTRGDRPLPLTVSMDLTGSTQKVFLRDWYDPTAAAVELTPTVTAAATGDLTADGAALDNLGTYQLQVEVRQGGVLVATFPDVLTPTILDITPDIS